MTRPIPRSVQIRAVLKSRRQWLQGAAATGALAVAPRVLAQAAPVRVGYGMARPGP